MRLLADLVAAAFVAAALGVALALDLAGALLALAGALAMLAAGLALPESATDVAAGSFSIALLTACLNWSCNKPHHAAGLAKGAAVSG